MTILLCELSYTTNDGSTSISRCTLRPTHNSQTFCYFLPAHSLLFGRGVNNRQRQKNNFISEAQLGFYSWLVTSIRKGIYTCSTKVSLEIGPKKIGLFGKGKCEWKSNNVRTDTSTYEDCPLKT